METILNQITGWSLFGFTMIDIVAVIFAITFNVKKTNKTMNKAIELMSKKEMPTEIELDIKEHISSETRTELSELKALLKIAIKGECYILQTFKAKNWLAGDGVPKEDIDDFLSNVGKSTKAIIKLVDKEEALQQTENVTIKTKRKVY